MVMTTSERSICQIRICRAINKLIQIKKFYVMEIKRSRVIVLCHSGIAYVAIVGSL